MPEESVLGPLTLAIDRTEDTLVVRCSGKLVAGVNEAFYAKLSQLIPNTKKIVLDLTDLTHMDSMGLGSVVRLYVSARSAGCSVQLINLGKRIRQLLQVTNLLSVLEAIGGQSISLM
jgi:anti-sigma B factor antagonist